MKCLECGLFLLFASSGNHGFDNVLVRIVSFISLGGRSHLGDVVTNILCLQALYQILRRKKVSGGPRPVASWSHCGMWSILDILCDPVMFLNASFCARCILANVSFASIYAPDRCSVVRNRSS